MKKYTINQTIILASLLTVSQFGLAETSINWLTTPTLKTLHSLQQKNAMTANQWQNQVVQYNANLIGDEIKPAENKGFVAESKSFYMDVNGAELAMGINIPVASKSAVIRLSSLTEKVNFDGNQVELTQDNLPVSKEVMATGEQLNKLGMAVPESTVAIKINHQPGTLRLKLNHQQMSQSKSSQDSHFVIHVLEPESPYRLTMSTAKQLYQAGEMFTVKAELLQEKTQLPVSIEGYISQPNGEKYAPLKFAQNKSGQMEAHLPKLPFKSMNNGLWEVHTIAKSDSAGQTILRDVSSAFAVSVPTAQFNGQLKLNTDEIMLGIDNKMASRYEASGLLIGHDKAGNPKPIAMLMTADWLKPGKNTLNFKLPQDLINESGLSAPFIVTDLNLKNQSLMAPVQQIASGFQFSIQ